LNKIAPAENGTSEIVAGFPPKMITNKLLTIEEADLCDSLVKQ
jgi:hypothetical protein